MRVRRTSGRRGGLPPRAGQRREAPRRRSCGWPAEREGHAHRGGRSEEAARLLPFPITYSISCFPPGPGGWTEEAVPRYSFGRLVLALPTTPAAWQAFWTSRVGPFDRLAIGGWHVARGRRFFLPLRHRLPRRSLLPLHPTSGRLRVASCTQCAADSLTPPTSRQVRLLFPPRGGVEHCRRFQGGAGREDRQRWQFRQRWATFVLGRIVLR